MAYERTWAFSFNNPSTPTSVTLYTQYEMFNLKAMLTGQLGGLVTGLWSMYSSCDSVSFGNGDAVDHWGSTFDATKIVNGSGAAVRSWYVLKSPSIAGSFWYLIVSWDVATGATYVSSFMCKTAPTGGTTTACPTSTDSWRMGQGVTSTTLVWNSGAASYGQYPMHSNLCLTSTGEFIFFTTGGQAGYPIFQMMMLNPVGCHVSDQFPLFTSRWAAASAGGCFVAVAFNGSTTGNNTLTGSGAAGGLAIININGSPGSVGFQLPDLLTGKMLTLPAWVFLNTNVGTTWHRRGRLPDIFCTMTNNTEFPFGATIRDGSNNITHVCVGNIYIPANVVPNLT
jgi:hypothetical protein